LFGKILNENTSKTPFLLSYSGRFTRACFLSAVSARLDSAIFSLFQIIIYKKKAGSYGGFPAFSWEVSGVKTD
jgi:hypothetical protein